MPNLKFSFEKLSWLILDNKLRDFGPNTPKQQYLSVTSSKIISFDILFKMKNLSLSLVAAELIILK